MPAKEVDDQGSQASDRMVGSVGPEGHLGYREGVAHSMRPSTTPPPPPNCRTAIAALAANAVLAGNSALPAKSAFPRRYRLRCGTSSGGFAVGRGPSCGTPTAIEGGNRLNAGSKIWVVPSGGGAVMTAEGG